MNTVNLRVNKGVGGNARQERLRSRNGIRSLLLLLFTGLLVAPVLATADCAPLTPYTATFDMMSGSKRHAVSTTTLSRVDAQTWRYGTDSEAKSFIAKLAGARVFEEAVFVRTGDELIPQRYSYDRSTRFRKRRDVIDFDWDAGVAHNSSGDKHWELELSNGDLDEYLVNLALIRALCKGEPELAFQVVDRKGHVDEQRYERQGEESVETPYGVFDTIKVERIRDTDRRQTFTWHAPELDYLPVRIRHVENDHDITAVLTGYSSGGES